MVKHFFSAQETRYYNFDYYFYFPYRGKFFKNSYCLWDWSSRANLLAIFISLPFHSHPTLGDNTFVSNIPILFSVVRLLHPNGCHWIFNLSVFFFILASFLFCRHLFLGLCSYFLFQFPEAISFLPPIKNTERIVFEAFASFNEIFSKSDIHFLL